MTKMTTNGVSTCKAGEEKYTTFRPMTYSSSLSGGGSTFYQYDYRHPDGELFSCCARSLEECREKRDSHFKNR